MNTLISSQNTDVIEKTKRYMPGLDGLRALSVLAVIAYHLNLSWASGGFLGVGIFFTLSGYLITDQYNGVAKDRQNKLEGLLDEKNSKVNTSDVLYACNRLCMAAFT